MPTITVAAQRCNYQWSRERPYPGVPGSWTATMTHEPYLSATASSQHRALQALRHQVLAHHARTAFWAAVNAMGDNDTWTAFEQALSALPEGDWLRDKLQADRAAVEASWARIDAAVAERIAKLDLEQAHAGFHPEPDADPGRARTRATAARDAVASRRAPCPNCSLTPRPRARLYWGPEGAWQVMAVCPCCLGARDATEEASHLAVDEPTGGPS
jgi:hypothetical protein